MIEQWLAPVSAEQPSGRNLEYEAEFQRLEEAAREELDAEVRRDGGEVVRSEGKRADWIQVQTLAESMLLRSKDLRLAVWLTRAWLHTRGFSGIADGLALIVGLLDTFWDDLHPELLDPDDPEGPSAMRANSLLQLASPLAVVRDLRGSWLLQSRRRGQLAVREIEIAQGRLKPADDKPALGEAQLIALLTAAIEENPSLPQQAQEALARVRTLMSAFADRAGTAPDLAPLQAVLYSVCQALKLVAPQVPAEEAQAADDAGPPAQQGTAAARSVPGEIRSREDVLQTLGRLCDYLVRHEPTNPVQFLLRRAQRMMNMSFLELMQDVAPDGLPQAETVVGEKLNKDEE